MDNMEYVIELENITKEFPGIVANDNISIKVKKGENLAYIYANDENLGQIIAQDVLKAYTVVDEIVDKKQDILKIL